MKSSLRKVLVCIFMMLTIMVNAEDFKFQSYYIYTNETERYQESYDQTADAKVCINEEKQEIELNLYVLETKKWVTFNLKINYVMSLAMVKEVGKLYMCTNNANNFCGVCICKTDKGSVVDLHNFFEGPQILSCRCKEEKSREPISSM